MSTSPPARRSAINPVELAIFAIVAIVFGNSVYRLLFTWEAVETITLQEAPSRSGRSEGRTPASLLERSFINLEIDCATESIEKTSNSKVRLTGPLCGASGGGRSDRLVSTEIVNTTNQMKATVFTFDDSHRFSTDYLLLNQGSNTLELRFAYAGGRVFSKTLSIVKQPGPVSKP